MLGTHGRVSLPDLDDGFIRVNNVQTGERIEHKLDGDLAELLIKPMKNIDMNEISNTAFRKYFEILNVAGISPRANNNRKIQAGRQIWNRAGQPAPPPNPPTPPPLNPEDDDYEPAGRGGEEQKDGDSDEEKREETYIQVEDIKAKHTGKMKKKNEM